MANPKIELFIEEFEQKQPVFDKIREIVLEQLKKFVSELGMMVNSVEGRVKTTKSLTGKLELKGDKYAQLSDITDLIGCRVVTFYSDEVDKIAAKVTSTFDVDWENSIDKRKGYQINQFGYMSLHYICRIPKELYYDEKYPEINSYRFEIQLRSVLQHTWATIYHDTGYKRDVEVPSEYLRQLNRLAGLLEIADESFKSIRIGLNDYRRRVKQIVKDGKLDGVELNGDTYKAYIDNGGFNALNNKIASINNMEIQPASKRKFLSVFKTLGCKTLKDLDDLVKNNADDVYRFAIFEFENTDIDIISDTAGPQTLCLVYILKNGGGLYDLVSILETVYGKRPNNERFAKKCISIGEKMGFKGE